MNGPGDRPFEARVVRGHLRVMEQGVRDQLFTNIGPVPCGRSFSLMMPSRLATSV